MYYYFPEGTTCAVLFKEMLSINDRNLIKIITAVLEKITISFLAAHLKGPFLELECLCSLGAD
jgi:hypothetical protein